jgi:hypothetical protein
MKGKIIMLREVLVLIVIASLYGCGTQDYADPKAETKPMVAEPVESLNWEEAALQAKENPAVLIPPQSGSEGNKDCPESTLCIRAPYLGAWQWRELASRFPGHVATTESEDEYRIVIGNAAHIQIETDIFEHEAGRLNLCGNTNLISTSLFSGSGELNASGSACRRLNGGAITLISYDIDGDPKIVTDGQNGEVGISATPPKGEERAPSGNAKDVKLSFDIKTLKGRWPITKAAADGVKESGADAALRYLRQLSQMGIYSEDALENHLNTNCQGCDKGTDRWYKSNNAGCFIYFQNDGLFDGASVKVENAGKLNGKNADPKKIWRGGNGQDGGNAGAIQILGSKSSPSPRGELSAIGGKAGVGGAGAYQLPGLGATATLQNVFHRNSEKHWVGCLVKKNGRLTEVHDWKYPTSRTLDLHFSIGGPTKYDRLGGSSGTLAAPRGSDGKALSKEVTEGLAGSPGNDGKSEVPDLRFETDPDFLASFEEICGQCSIPKILGTEEEF